MTIVILACVALFACVFFISIALQLIRIERRVVETTDVIARRVTALFGEKSS